MSNIHWLKTNNIFKKVNGDFSTIDRLPLGVYNVGLSLEGWYLEKYTDEFTFDYKIYGLETEFCEHVIKTFENTTGNLGIMLTGTKGTGKTVTAKLLANAFKLPVIIVKDMGGNNQGMIEYFSSFNFDSILFFDEFEKNFSEKDSTILQIMDGVYNIGYRKIFLLTTNQMTVNENLVGRPSRIRYVKKFGNLNLKTVKEYLDGFMHIQISTNSTNEDERKYLFGGADVVTIEEMKREFNNMPNNNRLITLNFICGAGWELDPNKLYGLDPNVFCVKITPLNITTATKEHGLEDAIQWNWENMNKIKEKVESCGLKVVVDVAAKAELPLCCGNLVQDYKRNRR